MTEKNKLFCRELLKHKFNQTRAYMAAYPGSSEEAARRDAARLMTNADVRNYLHEITCKLETKDLVSIEDVITGIKGDIDNARKKDKTHSAVMKGWELLGKYLKMFTDRQEIEETSNLNVNISLDPSDRKDDKLND
jgi:hypothetical protein